MNRWDNAKKNLNKMDQKFFVGFFLAFVLADILARTQSHSLVGLLISFSYIALLIIGVKALFKNK